jgi:hypothetical protein
MYPYEHDANWGEKKTNKGHHEHIVVPFHTHLPLSALFMVPVGYENERQVPLGEKRRRCYKPPGSGLPMNGFPADG